MKNLVRSLVVILVVATVAFVFINYYSYIFAKDVSGKVIGVQRLMTPNTVVSGANGVSDSQFFSFAVAIKNEKGEIFTGSSIDRQWAVVKEGMCAEAKFFPYPFWKLDKSETYFNVRLEKVSDCP